MAIEPLTPVIFKRAIEDGEIIAFFPQDTGTSDPYTMSCYVHNGQHCSGSIDYLQQCKPAKPDEYAPLARELQRIGYRLTIRRRHTRADLSARRAAMGF